MRSENLKLLEENMGGVLQDIGTGNNFLDRTQIDPQAKVSTAKRECIKVKNFCTTKLTTKTAKRQPQARRKSSRYSTDIPVLSSALFN
jgi:hypothetical protein